MRVNTDAGYYTMSATMINPLTPILFQRERVERVF